VYVCVRVHVCARVCARISMCMNTSVCPRREDKYWQVVNAVRKVKLVIHKVQVQAYTEH
jgi:hypothetical protein